MAESGGFEPLTQSTLRTFMAESGGFEPPEQVSPFNGLANRRLQPLGQLSGDDAGWDVTIITEAGYWGRMTWAEKRSISSAWGLD